MPVPSSLLVLLTALALGACRTSAQPADPVVYDTTDCEANRYEPRDGVRVCETRAFTLRGDRLAVDAEPNGAITVATWDRDDIEVVARVEAWASTDAEARQQLAETDVVVHGATVETRVPERDGAERMWSSVHYTVYAPRETTLDLRTVNGGIRVAGTTGRLTLRSVNGGLALSDVGGAISGTTVNGPIDLTPARGVADVDLQTTNGPVRLDAYPGFSAEVDARTTLGPVRIEGLPLTDEACGDRDTRYAPCMSGRVVGTLGQGGPDVRLRTTNGPISLRER